MSDLDDGHRAEALLADCLFCSDLQTGSSPSDVQVAAAIRSTLKKRRNWDGFTRAVIAAFRDDIDSASQREAWCRELAERALGAGDFESEVDRWK